MATCQYRDAFEGNDKGGKSLQQITNNLLEIKFKKKIDKSKIKLWLSNTKIKPENFNLRKSLIA